MRRPTRLGLLAVILLLVAAGAYTVFWFAAARRLEHGVGLWAQSLRQHDLDLSWQKSRVDGFPLVFRLVLSDAQLRDRRPGATGAVRLPLLVARAAPWNFRVWQLAAPQGLAAASGAGPHPLARVSAQSARGSILVSGKGATLWFAVDRPAADAGMTLAAQQALLWLILPPQPPAAHTEPALGIALEVRKLRLPAVPPPFHNPLDELSFGLTVNGTIPTAPPRRAAAAWRDAGGTVALDHLRLRWGPMLIDGSGTLALDAALQPEGSFSGGVEGYGALMQALVASGRMRARNAGLAGLALAFLAKRGPDGRPRIPIAFTIQNGEMYLGPARLGPTPRIDWK
jgi:Uncharacterized protein conserved in bacteria (DUF2125)